MGNHRIARRRTDPACRRRFPLDPTPDDLWAYVDAFDQAQFAGVHQRDRGAWLDGFERIAALVETKDGSLRFLKHVVRESAITFVPSVIAAIEFGGPWLVIVGTILGFGGAVVSFRNIAREMRERADRRLLLEAVNQRLPLL